MEKISVHAILEVLGRPAQNVLDALNSLIEKMKAEKELTVISSTVHEPVQVKDTKDLFTSFAEVDLEFPSLHHLFGFLFVYMPSNVEISYPENFERKDLTKVQKCGIKTVKHELLKYLEGRNNYYSTKHQTSSIACVFN